MSTHHSNFNVRRTEEHAVPKRHAAHEHHDHHHRSHRPKRPWRGRLRLWLLLLLASGTSLGAAYGGYLVWSLPDISDPSVFFASQSTVITDRNGIELYRLFDEQDRTLLPSAQIPDTLKNAIVAIEDERFFTRGCLDIRALLRAVLGFGSRGGASTLTRQLARNVLDLKSDHVVTRKLKELLLGCTMEGQYEKDEILSLYLNWIPFGQNAYGVEQASQKYFGKSGTGLTLAESAVLASLPQRPSYFNPYGEHVRTSMPEDIVQKIIRGEITKTSEIDSTKISIGLLGKRFGTGAYTLYIGGRSDQVLRNMQDQGHITEADRLTALNDLETITFKPLRESIRAPHFVLWVRDLVEELFPETGEQNLLEHGGMTIQTTLDWRLQEVAEGLLKKNQEDLLNRFGVNNAALIAVDSATREIIAYAGNIDYADQEHGGKIDMIQVPRQPGSSFKPLVYAAAFEQGYGPATVLFDVKTKFGDDEPQNFDGTFLGPISARTALGGSRNIPAVKAFFLAGGEENVLDVASSLGATAPRENRLKLRTERGTFDYGWPLALGAGETPMLEMVNAYASLANGGKYQPLLAIKSIKTKDGGLLFSDDRPAPQQVLDERIAYQVTSVLSDESARPTEYWKSQLTIPGYQTAAKTGTSNKCLEWKDANTCKLRKPDNGWVLGYTPALTAGVWVGNADSSAMFDKGDGLTTASPIWKEFLVQAHKILKPATVSFVAPAQLVQPQISLLSGELPTDCTPVELRGSELFLAERAPSLEDPACVKLKVDKVTGLLASDTCPEEAQEEKAFFKATSVAADRWPNWQSAVDNWMLNQTVIWNATENHSGSLLKLPPAPTLSCDPNLTPGRLIKPELTILSPIEGGIISFPAFSPEIRPRVGSSVREVRYTLDDKPLSTFIETPFTGPLRIPRSIKEEGTHVLSVTLVDEYYNEVTENVTVRFGEDEHAPTVELLSPKNGLLLHAGDTLTLRAKAEDEDGGIRFVQFYLDDVLLSTKPSAPYELEYVLDAVAGSHTVRAVAEDMAEKQSEDEVRITVVPTGQVLDDENGSTEAQEPTIMLPAEDTVSLERNAMLTVVFSLPEFGNGGALRTVEAAVRGTDGQSDTLLSLRDGGGTYTREWASATPGTYTLVLTSMDRAGTESIWREVTVEVK